MTLLPRALAASLLIASLVACSGSEGPRGEDGAPGKDGENGENGENGAPGKDGENGAPGEDGETGAPGEDGEDGEDGETGAPGEDGEDASDTASPMVVRGVVAHEIEAVGAEMLAVSADGRYGLAAGKDVATYFEIGPARLEVIGTLTLPTEHYPEGSSVADFTGLSIHPSGDYALIAVRDIDPANMDFSAIFDEVPGKVIAVSLPDLTVLGEVEVGRGPDSVAIAKNGEFAVVANEDEEDETNLTDLDNRAGSLSVIDLRDGPTNLAQVFVPLESEDLPFFGHDPQPETVKIAPDDSFIVATLQENNAITRVDVQSPLPSPLMADAFTVTHFDAGTRRGLGLVSGGAGSDSCASSSYDLSLREVYFSAREPDGIAVTPDGRFLVTADEDNIIALNDQSWEGEPISPHGSRSISVYDAETGEFLGDSGETIEEGITARQLPMRCSSKGPEPEVVSVGEVNGRTLAFVSLERSDAISIHDVTDPENLLLLDVVPLNPSVIAADEGPQYEPEGIEFIPGRNLVVVSSPEAARLTLVELRLHDVIGDVVIPEGDPASIVISEVNSDLAPDDWIELHNQGPLAVNLTGFSFTDDDPTHVYTFPAGTVLGAGEFLVVGTPDDFSFGLGGEDAVYLYSADEALLDSFQWGETTSPWGENHVATVSRCVNPSAAAGYSFWPTTGEQGLGSPTPGEANDCLPPSVAGQSDVVLNEIRTQGDDFVELYNRGASTIDLSGWRLGDEGGGMFVFPAATTIDPGAFLVVEGDWTTGPLALTFGLGSGDSATLLSPYDVVVDTTAWTSHQNTGSRCPDGTGTFVSTTETKGSANLCE